MEFLSESWVRGMSWWGSLALNCQDPGSTQVSAFVTRKEHIESALTYRMTGRTLRKMQRGCGELFKDTHDGGTVSPSPSSSVPSHNPHLARTSSTDAVERPQGFKGTSKRKRSWNSKNWFQAMAGCSMGPCVWPMITLAMEVNLRIELRETNSRSYVLDSIILTFVVVTFESFVISAPFQHFLRACIFTQCLQ